MRYRILHIPSGKFVPTFLTQEELRLWKKHGIILLVKEHAGWEIFPPISDNDLASISCQIDVYIENE